MLAFLRTLFLILVFTLLQSCGGGAGGNADSGSANAGGTTTTASTAAVPLTPASLTVSAGDALVVLNWSPVEGATSYRVRRATTAGGPYSLIGSPTGTSFNDGGRTNGTTYYYVISAVNSAGESAASSEEAALPVAGLPSVPTTLSAAGADTQITLSWAASANATRYKVKRATTAGGPYSTVATVPYSPYTDTGRTNGATVYYVVSAVGTAGESADSVSISASAVAGVPAATVPAAPTGLFAIGSDTQIVFSWTASSTATSYVIKRATTANGPYTQIASVASAPYTDTGRTNGTTYYYVVSAVNSVGEGAASSVVSATPVGVATPAVAVPAAPTGINAVAGDSQVALSWNASTGANSYKLYRAGAAGGPFTQLAVTTAAAYTNTALSNGATYYYRITALNTAGESAVSSTVSATPAAAAAGGSSSSTTTPETTGPKLGMNLDWAKDWSSVEAFNDLMMQSRGFAKAGHISDPGAYPAALDGNGWPTEDFGFVAYARGINEPTDSYLDLYFKCKSSAPSIGSMDAQTASVVAGSLALDGSTGVWHARIKLKRGGHLLGIGIGNTNGGATDIHLYREGADHTKTFNPKFIAFMKGYDTYRFMEMLHTNNSVVTQWSERTLPTSVAQDAKGIAWEYVVEFANETRGNIWINIPHKVDDNYILNLAQLLKSGLKYNQAVYIEYSNEIWNGMTFVQGGWNTAQAFNEVQNSSRSGTPSELDKFCSTINGKITCVQKYIDPATKTTQADITAANTQNNMYTSFWSRFRVTRRSREIAKIFAGVFGEAALNNQVRVLIPGWGAVLDYSTSQLNWLKYAYPNEPVNKYIYGIATGAYIGDESLTQSDGTKLATSALNSRDEIYPWLLRAVNESNSTANFAKYKALADLYGIKNVIYEGGVDLQHTPTRSSFINAIGNNWNPLRDVKDLPLTPDSKGVVPISSATDITLMNEDSRHGDVIHALLSKWFTDTNNSLFVWYKPAVKDAVWIYSDSMDNFATVAQKALRVFANWSPTLTAAATPARTLYDFNGDGRADVLWRYTTGTGDNRLFRMKGTEIQANVPVAANSDQNWQVAATADFDNDGKTDIFWRNSSTGENRVQLMSEAKVTQTLTLPVVATSWTLEAAGDVDGDGKADLLWRNAAGATHLYRMNGAAILADVALANHSAVWKMMGMRDFNGDGKADLLWYNASTGETRVELMNGTQVLSSTVVGTNAAPWVLLGAGDFNGDGKADLLWANSSTNRLQLWTMNGSAVVSMAPIKNNTGANNVNPWEMSMIYATTKLLMIGDFDGDGKADMLWYTTTPAAGTTAASNTLTVHIMNGNLIEESRSYGGYVNPAWTIATH